MNALLCKVCHEHLSETAVCPVCWAELDQENRGREIKLRFYRVYLTLPYGRSAEVVKAESALDAQAQAGKQFPNAVIDRITILF